MNARRCRHNWHFSALLVRNGRPARVRVPPIGVEHNTTRTPLHGHRRHKVLRRDGSIDHRHPRNTDRCPMNAALPAQPRSRAHRGATALTLDLRKGARAFADRNARQTGSCSYAPGPTSPTLAARHTTMGSLGRKDVAVTFSALHLHTSRSHATRHATQEVCGWRMPRSTKASTTGIEAPTPRGQAINVSTTQWDVSFSTRLYAMEISGQLIGTMCNCDLLFPPCLWFL